jgi:hypothetical protein
MAESAFNQKSASTAGLPLPERMRQLFWDYSFEELRLDAHRDFIIGRVLADGDWESVRWLRHEVGDDALREWIIHRKGRGMSRKQIRFWELILKISESEVERWLAERGPGWDDRVRR